MKLNWYKNTKDVEFGQEYEKRTPCGEKVETHSLSFKDVDISSETSNG